MAVYLLLYLFLELKSRPEQFQSKLNSKMEKIRELEENLLTINDQLTDLEKEILQTEIDYVHSNASEVKKKTDGIKKVQNTA